MKCNKCGSNVEKDWVRCPKCMEYLNRTCPSCNEVIDFNWRACPKCGNIFEDNNIIQEEYNEIPTENKTQIYSDTHMGANSNLTQNGVKDSEFSRQTNERVGFGRRLCAYGIDILLIYGIIILSTILIELIFDTYYWTDSYASIVVYTDALIVFILYFTYFEGVKGQTLGKKLLHLKVVSEEGISPIGIKKALLRTTLGRFLAGIFFGIGYIIIAINQDDRQGLHDQIAKTYVIKT